MIQLDYDPWIWVIESQGDKGFNKSLQLCFCAELDKAPTVSLFMDLESNL